MLKYKLIIKAFIGGVLFCCSISSCSLSKPRETDVVILYTADQQGACIPYDYYKDMPSKASLGNVYTYISQERKLRPNGVLLFDTGDFLDGQPSLSYYNNKPHLKHIAPKTMNFVRYDALGVGNHDIEASEEVYLNRVYPELNMPWVCANAIDTYSGETMFSPYATFTRNGIKIVVLGMTTPHATDWIPKNLWPHLKFQDMVECAAIWIPIIKEKEKPDMIIGLFHSGTEYQKNGNKIDTYMNENGGIPAAILVPGFDLVLLGYDNNNKCMDVTNINGDTVKVIDCKAWTETMGRVDVHFTYKNGKYEKDIRLSHVDMTKVPADPDYMALIKSDQDSINEYMDRNIGYLSDSLTTRDCYAGPSELINFINDVQLWATEADVSIANITPRRTVKAGELKLKDIFKMYPYKNQIFKLRMTGEEIRRLLEVSYWGQFNLMESANDHLLAFQTDAEGNVVFDDYGAKSRVYKYNYTNARGINYIVDVSKPKGQRVKITSLSDGRPFNLNEEYSIAMNSYLANGGGNLISEALNWDNVSMNDRLLLSSSQDFRKYITEYIVKHGTINPQKIKNNWSVIPHDWWMKNKERDLDILFSTSPNK